jgi:D-sedoheptulose 7-phosphate isomerase
MEPANLSAIANDVGVELVFQRQLIANGRPQDVAVAISTSGKLKNLAAALGEARKRGMLTIGFAGYEGGDFVRERLVDYAFVVRSD